MERLYTSPTYGMWYSIDEKSLSSNLPPMVVFPETTEFYTKWQKDLESKGVKVRLNTELDAVLSRSPTVKVLLRGRRQQEDLHNPNSEDHDLPQKEEEFDEIVFCVLADTAKRILGKNARGIEKWVLGNTKWSDDVTVTHTVGCPIAPSSPPILTGRTSITSRKTTPLNSIRSRLSPQSVAVMTPPGSPRARKSSSLCT
jgi:hypothetical protein